MNSNKFFYCEKMCIIALMGNKKQLCINLPPEIIDLIQQYARDEHRSDSAMGRVLIAEALDARMRVQGMYDAIAKKFNIPNTIIEGGHR